MSISVPIFIGFRYSKGRNRNRFGTVVALFSLIGMAIGVCALILVLSVMNGFNAEIAGRMQTLAPDLTLTRVVRDAQESPNADPSQDIDTYLQEEVPEAVALSPVVESFVMLNSGSLQRPMNLLGIDPVQDEAVVGLSAQIIQGDLDSVRSGEFGIVLGSYAAASLRLTPGDQVQATLPALRMTPAGLFPRQKNFRVVAIFDTGSQLDAEIAYAYIDDVSRVLGRAATEESWRVKLQDVDLSDSLAEKIQRDLGQQGWTAETWAADYQSLFQAMKMEKLTVGLLLMIIVLVAAFNIVTGLIMMVSDKRSDMAVLRTLGAGSGTVIRIFVVQGLILGLTGILLGALLGTVLAIYLSDLVAWFEAVTGGHLFDPSVFYVSFLPSEWRFQDFIGVIVSAAILTLIATLLPARQAARISPREALNYKQ